MNKLKENFKQLLGNQKEILKKYNLTFILIACITIFMILGDFRSEHIEKIRTTLILTNILFFVIEALLDFKWYRIIGYIIAFVISIISKSFIYRENFTTKQELFIAGFYFSTVILAIYKIIKDSKVTVSQYLSKVFSNNIVLAIASAVLQMGTMFVVFTINTLLFKNTGINLYLKAEILLFGFFMIPAEILCLLNVKNETLKPIQILICYIILPIVTIAELVIYIYFLKILIIREIPSNRIFSIIASLFMFACPTWIMIENFKNKNKYIKANAKIIPYSFIPLILMQIYAIGVRIFEMGLTPERYLGVMLILFEIISVTLTLVKNQKFLSKTLLAGIAFVLILMCIPGINVIDASWESQLVRLISVYKQDTKFEDLSEEDKIKVISAYNYLKEDEEGEKHIPEYIDKTKINSNIINYTTRGDAEIDYELITEEINYESETEEIPVEGFKKAKKVDFRKYSYKGKIKVDELDLYSFETYEDKNVNEEIKNKIKKIIEDSINKGDIVNEKIEINENTSFWFSTFSAKYVRDTKEIERLNISGYLLMK